MGSAFSPVGGPSGSGIVEVLDETRLAEGVTVLTTRDPSLAMVVERFGVPPMWSRKPGFPTLLKTILEQQVSLASARAAYQRLLAAVGSLTPQSFLQLDDPTLRGIGFSRQKARYGRLLAQGLVEGSVDLDQISVLADDEARAALTRLTGIGPWTADTYLLMAMRRADVWPAGDIALQTAVQDLKGLPSRPTSDEMDELAEPWRPWRAVAARILWFHYLDGVP